VIAQVLETTVGVRRSPVGLCTALRVQAHHSHTPWFAEGTPILAVNRDQRAVPGFVRRVEKDGAAVLFLESEIDVSPLGRKAITADLYSAADPAASLVAVTAMEWTDDIEVFAQGSQGNGGQCIAPSGGFWWNGARPMRGDLIRVVFGSTTLDYQLREDATHEASISRMPLLRGCGKARLARRLA